MSSTHQVSTTYTVDGVQIGPTNVVSGIDDTTLEHDIAVADSTTNQIVRIAFLKAQLKSMYLYSDRAITIKTNSTGSPSETIALAAKTPYLWTSASYVANPLVTDITQMYISNASGGVANVSLRFLVHGSI